MTLGKTNGSKNAAFTDSRLFWIDDFPQNPLKAPSFRRLENDSGSVMKRLYRAANLPDAYLLLHRLQHAGIEARVLNEHAQGGVGEIPFTHAYPEVWLVEPVDADRARSVVADFERRTSSETTVVCPFCYEESPGSFEICWRCGATIDR